MSPNPNTDIAIIGIGCRFPGGASNPDAFWDILKNGVDATTDVPPERWSLRRFYDPDPTIAGRIHTKRGGYLRESIRPFDAAFFGIAPREAAPMDPQQRLLLEVAWEAFEDAGLVPHDLSGSKTGVYVGGFTADNLLHQLNAVNREAISSHTAVSATLVMLSNRLSYVFDLKGPSLTVDTACSSSMVALHLAVQGLRRGECTLALAAGVSLMFRPAYSIAMSKGGFLAPDGRCKSFDARGDGYGRGEGAGVLVLKPLPDALRDGDRILSVIVETGVNQDGRTDGITLPSRASQVALIREVYARAGLAPHQVGYVEAHGTGTRAGDTTELHSLSEAITRDRPRAAGPLPVGSVKSNIGHLEAAAGVAGVIKATLALRHGKLPPSLHFTTPPDGIDLDAMGLEVVTRFRPWPTDGHPRLASVNAFGYGGTNGHVILREAPPPQHVPSPALGNKPLTPRLIPLSARSDASLTRQVMRLHQVLKASPGTPLRDLGYTLARRRTHHDHRVAIIARSADDLRHTLRHVADTGEVSPGFVRAATPPGSRSVAFVYTGMGAQSWGMGRALLASDPVAAAALERCDTIWRRLADWSLRDLFARSDGTPMTEPKFAQPANVALQIMVTDVLRGHGLRPAAVVGHSAGEMAAAWAAGSLSLEDALRVTWHRSRLQQSRDGQGRMLAVGLAACELDDSLTDGLDIAATNSPGSVALAGDPDRIEAVARRLEARGVFHKALPVRVAYHSRHMDGLEADLLAGLAELAPQPSAIPLYSTVTGTRITVEADDPGQTPAYWWRNLRQPVAFSSAITAMIRDGHDLFLEIGPHPALTPLVQDGLRTAGRPGDCLPTLRRGQEGATEPLLEALAQVYVRGVDLAWEAPYPEGALVPLLPYPWDREDLWVETDLSKADRLGNNEHPILARRVNEVAPVWDGTLSGAHHPYLLDHRIQGEAVFPAAGYVELALVARPDKSRSAAIENLQIHGSLATLATPVLRVQPDGPRGRFGIHCRENTVDAPWTEVASGHVLTTPVPPLRPRVDLADLRRHCTTPLVPKAFYAEAERHGLEYGPAFRSLQEGWIGSGQALVRLALPDTDTPTDDDYFIHPVLLDGALQAVLALRLATPPRGTTDNTTMALPVGLDQLRFHAKVGRDIWCHVTAPPVTAPHTTETDSRINLTLFDNDGVVRVEVFGLRLRPVPLPRASDTRTLNDLLYTAAWSSTRAIPRDHPGPTRWLVFADSSGVTAALQDLGGPSRMMIETVTAGPSYARTAPNSYILARGARDHMARLLHDVDMTTLDGILYLWPIDLADDLSGPEDDVIGQTDLVDVLHLLQALASMDTQPLPPITIGVVATQIARHGDAADGAPGQSALWSAVQTARLELPQMRLTMVDLTSRLPFAAATQLITEVRSMTEAPAVAARGTDRLTERIVRLGEERYRSRPAPDGTNVMFDILQRGGVQKRCFVEAPWPSPGPGQVSLAIRSFGLDDSHRPALRSLKPLDRPRLDLPCIGTVTATGGTTTGGGENGLSLGQRVLAVTDQTSFGAALVVGADRVLPCPDDLPPDREGDVFDWLMAWHALVTIADRQAGHTLLVQEAGSGFGEAITRLALEAGLSVLATASTARQRKRLRKLGITHIAASDTLAFRDMAATVSGGQGIDVVVSPLRGDARIAGLDCLRPRGVYLDHAPLAPDETDAYPIRFAERDIRFHRLSLAKALTTSPTALREALIKISQRLASGTLPPLPQTRVSARDLDNALKTHTRGRTEGRLVVEVANRLIPAIRPRAASVVDADAAYLVTGGFGGIGLEILRWLAARGARSIAVVSRSGPTSNAAQQTIRDLNAAGVTVTAEQADMADSAALTQALARLRTRLPAIRGVIHAAGALADAMMDHQDTATLDRVLGPKARGALALHRAFAADDLRFFVCLGSISGAWGNTGQYNYAGANGFLQGLIRHRRARGLPGTCINLGPVAGAGMAGRDARTLEHLGRIGLRPLPMAVLHEVLDDALGEHWGSFEVADIDWSLWAQTVPARERPRLTALLTDPPRTTGASAEAFRSRILALPAGDRRAALFEVVADIVASALKIPKSRIDQTSSLSALGADSLMAADVIMGVLNRTGVRLRTLYVVRGPALADMVERLDDSIMTGRPPAP